MRFADYIATHEEGGFSELGTGFYALTQPTALSNPRLLLWSDETASLIGLERPDDAEQAFSGNISTQANIIYSSAYSGHQFGHFVPNLGDGRAHTIGEVAQEGRTYEIQLKGSGKTPFSRFGDGKAVLRSSIREFLASEYMAALGIPTTRALCLVAGDDRAMREMPEPCAITTRVAESFLRFGHAEFHFHEGNAENLRSLFDFVVEAYHPQLAEALQPLAALFHTIVLRTAELMAQWQAAGFTHGVMNTDNMSLLGLTLDYGPFGFLDRFDFNYSPNHTDEFGRYAYGEQPSVGLWNLNALAVCFSAFVERDALVEALKAYEPHYLAHYHRLMGRKLGFARPHSKDANFIRNTLHFLHENGIDYSYFFRSLSRTTSSDELSTFAAILTPENEAPMRAWLGTWQERLAMEESVADARQQQMLAANPAFLLRNAFLQQAIDAAYADNFAPLHNLFRMAQTPFTEKEKAETFLLPPKPDNSNTMCSCSS